MNDSIQEIANIALPIPSNHTFDYLSTDSVRKGEIVKVKLNSRSLVGLVLGISHETNKNGIKLRNIEEKLPISFSNGFVDFIKWVSDYNLIPIGLAFKLAFSEKLLVSGKKETKYYRFSDTNKKNITKTQQNVVNFLEKNKEMRFSYEKLKDFCSLNIIRTLVKNSVIIEEKTNLIGEYGIDLNGIELNKLTPEQEEIYQKIKTFDEKKPILLEGITGSGKTEIYFHLFKDYLARDNSGQVLFLLPEIALTNQFINRFKEQFRCSNVVVWHSDISNIERSNIWKGVYAGGIRIVIGARSSLFLPFKNLKLIVVDEEHDASYKQTENGCYNARDMANVRAKIENCKVVLGSATPSVESLINVEKGKYEYCYLKSRYGKSIVPVVEVIDLKKEKMKKDKYLSKYLVDEMRRELEKNNQILLFLNRRGYAPIAICRECGHRFLCKNCSCNLTVHSQKKRFICHQCGYSIQQTTACPECGNADSVVFFGPGVEKIEKEVNEIFIDKKSLIITSDTLVGSKKIKETVDKIHNHDIDIIIGTQMITKGYDFSYLTLVGVVDADASLFGANFRASERTYQLLTQVIGRVGRREKPGKAVLQTYNPDNLIIRALIENDKNKILEYEKINRKSANLPPYGKLILVIFHGKTEITVYRKIKEFVNLFPVLESVDILGPTPTDLYKVNNHFRFKVIFKSHNDINIQKIISNTLEKLQLGGDISVKIDVNPYFIE